MAAPVWVLSVDLQTKTATFQSGMAEAAKSARSAFTDIKSGAGEMGASVGGATYSARQGVMLLGEEFGVHLPRGLTTFISSLGPVGPALEAAFPFVAIAVGATLLLQHLASLKVAGQALTQEQTRFGTTVQNVFNSLDQKLLQAGIRSDELRNDHLGALAKQLQLIDRQSMDELAQSFARVAAEADGAFKKLQVSWYNFGTGSSKAKERLDDFQTQYDSLIAKGDKAGATDLLKGSLGSAQKVLDAQKAADANKHASLEDPTAQGEYIRAANVLKAEGVGYTERETKSYQALVEALQAQVGIEGKVAELKKQDSSNASTSTGKEMASQAAAMAKAAADSRARIGELALQADKARATAEADITRASIEERTSLEVAFANREMELRLQANGEQIAALDKMANDYPAKLKELQEKSAEIVAQHQTSVAEITAKGSAEAAARDLQNIEEGIRESIEATQQGSAARLAAIDAAIKLEAAKNMQGLASYRDLLTQRTEAARQSAEEDAKLAADAGKEEADNAEKMGELMLAAAKEHQALIDSGRRASIARQVAEDTQAANAEYALKLTAMQREAEALDKTAKDYENKLKAIQDKEKQLVQQHENEVTAIRDKAEMERNQKILSADNSLNNVLASNLAQLAIGHKSFAATMTSIGNQVVSGMMQNAIESVLANDYTKESDAAAAARKAYLAGMHFPFPANVVMGPVLGAAAFASVMAFNAGTDSVPGIGNRDVVPALLTPGEGVVPGGVMDGLRNMVQNGGMKGNTTHIRAHFAPTVHAMDSDGVDRVLKKHADKFQKHFEGVVRKMNR